VFKIVAYLLAAGFFVQESLVREGGTARSLERGETDRGTTVLLVTTYGLALLGTPILNRLARSRLPRPVAAVGLGAMAAGLGLRYWAVRTLGEAYSRTLRTLPGQRLVDSGPYALIRHPGYAASLLVWIGFGLAQGSLLSALGVGLAMGAAYGYRIRAEEEMLGAALGEPYERYSERTARLIPAVF
jgi:protein-S-isoprenylcysteine O-methyltransferase